MQNGTVEAQENPLTTIEAKKFYDWALTVEAQKLVGISLEGSVG